MKRAPTRGLALLFIILSGTTAVSRLAVAKAEPGRVTFWHLPDGAIQPQAVTDSGGTIHVLYFQGDAKAGNLFYLRLAPEQTRPSEPIQVNSEPSSAGAIGTVRTAQIAAGKDSRVHVVWNGLGPKNENGYPTSYQAYTRLNAAGTAFEPQRNLTTWAKGLDGGGSVAADKTGNVYVTWHALANAKEEAGRAVFISISRDSGKTFTREKQANPETTGACACCGMKAFADSKGILTILYRAAGENTNRDTMRLISRDAGKTFEMKRLDRWNLNACPMATYALTESNNEILGAWETKGRIYAGAISPVAAPTFAPAPDFGAVQKHPFLAAGANGQSLLVWTEGTGWQKGGTLAWQRRDAQGKPIESGSKPGAVPIWGLASAYARPDGGFVILY